ncbi:MAG: hypothetical protein WCE64_11865 [Bacteroidales bacterium]
MPDLIPIRVECHAGYKADEYPKCFYLKDNRYEISEIEDRWYQGDYNPEWPVSNYYKVRTKDEKRFIIKHEIEKDVWYLCK